MGFFKTKGMDYLLLGSNLMIESVTARIMKLDIVFLRISIFCQAAV